MKEKSKTSEVYKNVLFDGTYKENSPEGITFQDKWVLPLIAPTINMNYSFPLFELTVNIEEESGLMQNIISADSRPTRTSNFELFEESIDDLFLETKKGLKDMKDKICAESKYHEKYPGLDLISIDDYSDFQRYITATTREKLKDVELSSLKQELEKEYGNVSTNTKGNYTNILIENTIKLQHQSPKVGDDQIVFILPPKYKKQEYDFLFNLLSENSNIQPIIKSGYSGIKWSIRMPQESYPILEQYFKPDIKILKKEK